MGRIPGTRDTVAIPDSKAPAFKPGKALKDTVDRGQKPEAEEQPDDGDRERRGRPGTGQALDVSVWPGGLEPVRKLLDPESALEPGNEPSPKNRAVRLTTDLTEGEFAGPAFVRKGWSCSRKSSARTRFGCQTTAVSTGQASRRRRP